MKYQIVTLLSFLFFENNAQNITSYYYKLYKADSFAINGELDSALLKYEEAFKNIDHIHSRILTKKAIPIANKAKNKLLTKKYKSILKSQKKCPKENKEILHQIDSIFKLDQKIRVKKYYNAQVFIQKHKDNPLINNSKKYLKLKKIDDYHIAVDSSNIKLMFKLIGEHGYIGDKIIGAKNHFKTYVILLHFDKDTNNLLLGSILNKALLNFQITPLEYAMIIDRHLYNTLNTQKYWTWFMIGEDPKLTDVQIETIMKLREKIGLWGTEYKISNYKGTWMLNNLTRNFF